MHSYDISLTTVPGVVKQIKKGKVAVFTCPLDTAQTETKGTVLIKSADEMLNFTSGEEKHLEKVCTNLRFYQIHTHRGSHRSSKRSQTPA